MNQLPKYLVRSSASSRDATMHVRHPLNPKSEIHMTRLSDAAGLQRVGVNLARIPPGRESYLPHAHAIQEEWVYVLSGRGRALIDDTEYDIGPGDFLGFPTDGTVHHLTNSGDEDLVLLQGGERGSFEVASFPTVKKRMVVTGGSTAEFFPSEAAETLPFTAWLAQEDGTPSPR